VEPVEYVLSLVGSRRTIQAIELSVYTNVPESLIDERVSKRTSVRSIRKDFDALTASLLPGQEIAFHSRVLVGTGEGKAVKRHIPLVDFRTPDRRLAEEAADVLIREQEAIDAALFGSGRSYHLYIGTLMPESEWVRFMGRLLLLNPREGPAVIDARWVGHRLMSGFGALRWSANTPPYTRPPQLLRCWGNRPLADQATA